MEVLKMLVNISFRGRTMESSQRRIMWPVIMSGPLDLLGSMLRICVSMSLLSKVILDKNLFVMLVKVGNMLSFTFGLHCTLLCRYRDWDFDRYSQQVGVYLSLVLQSINDPTNLQY